MNRKWSVFTRPVAVVSAGLLVAVVSSDVMAQTSSLASIQRKRQEKEGKVVQRVDGKANPVVLRYSMFAVPDVEPKVYQRGDLITIIVRQQASFESDADMESSNEFQVDSTIDAFAKFIDGGLGATTFARGKPNIAYEFERENRNEADVTSRNRFTTRVTGTVIDVKPNGNLVLMARAQMRHGEESNYITVTGTCSEDRITADGSVLSTDLADQNIQVVTKGAVNDGAKRGWLTRAFDFLKPF